MVKVEIHVGCCGYAVSREKYVKNLSVVELQSTFYKIPREDTVERWRQEVPDDFIFIVKAFQGITHPADSPTWRRSNVKPTSGHGELKPTDQVMKSWEMTKRICDKLRAPICVIQTPASFKDSPSNLSNAEQFFKSIDRGGMMIGFEPRGWSEESIIKLCKRFELIHVVDPFASNPLWTLGGKTAYLRLHGKPPGSKMYRYTYTDDDLIRLLRFIERLSVEEAYVMFNNVSMFNDALRFKKMIGAV